MADPHEPRATGAEAIYATALAIGIAAAAKWIAQADTRFVVLALFLGLTMAYPAIASWQGWSKAHPGIAASIARTIAGAIIVAALWAYKSETDGLNARLAPLVADSTARAAVVVPTTAPDTAGGAERKRLATTAARAAEVGRRMQTWRRFAEKCAEYGTETPDLTEYRRMVASDSTWLARAYSRPVAEDFAAAVNRQADGIDAWWKVELNARAKFGFLSDLR